MELNSAKRRQATRSMLYSVCRPFDAPKDNEGHLYETIEETINPSSPEPKLPVNASIQDMIEERYINLSQIKKENSCDH